MDTTEKALLRELRTYGRKPRGSVETKSLPLTPRQGIAFFPDQYAKEAVGTEFASQLLS